MAYRTVLLKSVTDNFIELEVNTGETVQPGMLVERVAGGKCQPHSTAGGNVQVLVAIENYLEGEDVDTSYAAGDIVICKPAVPGERFAMLQVDDSSDGYGVIAEGDFLESDGEGYLREHTVLTDESAGAYAGTIYTKSIVGVALEANDMTDSSTADDERFAVEIV